MGADFKFFLVLLKMTIKSASMQRGAMLIRAVFSVVTHLIYIPVWVVIFSVAPDIGGWTLKHAFFSYGLCMSCWGIVSLIAFGLRTLPEQIDHGELDSYLTLPRPVLLSVAISSSRNTGLGELVFGISLLAFCGIYFSISLVFVPLFLVMGSVLFASGILLFATLGFWLKQFLASAEEIYFNFNLMASRPAPVFSGFIKIVALTLFPVSLMTHIPIEFIFDGHQGMLLGYAVIGISGYAVIAVSFFYTGLRHYESGNRFGVRG